MECILDLLEDPGRITAEDKPLLEETAKRFPWFVHPRMLLLRLAEQSGDGPTADRVRNGLALRLACYPAPPLLLEEPDWSTLRRRGSMDIVDDFLAVGDKRIVPDETRADGAKDLSLAEETDDDLVSEALAKIYASQGLTSKPQGISRRPSLA